MKTQGYLTDSYQISLTIDGYDYVADRTSERGGKDSGTSPHGLLLGSVAACKLMVAKSYLDHNQIPYERVDVNAESKIKGKKRRETIEIDVYITVNGADMSEKDLNYMTRIVEKGCTIANILTAGEQNTVTTTISSV